MKFGSFIFATTALAFGLTTEATEEQKIGNVRSGERKLYSWPSYYYGFGEADKVWKKEGYKCTSDDVEDFENFLSKADICERQYRQNNDFIRACNDGIKDYYTDKEKKCFASKDECAGFGEAISEGIIAMHCQLSLASFSSKQWPKECKEIGIKECQKNINDSSSYKQYSKNCNKPSGSQLRRLDELCVTEVNNYLSGPPPSPSPPSVEYNRRFDSACDSSDTVTYNNRDRFWCEDKCVDNLDKKTCFGYSYEKSRDRCRIFYDYPVSRRSQNGVDCWRADDPWDVCRALTSNGSCRDCCRDVEGNNSDQVKKCRKYAGCD